MDIKKLAPWNWFKKEEEAAGTSMPVQYPRSREHGYALGRPFDQLHQDMDRLFDNLWRGIGLPSRWGYEAVLPRLAGSLLKPTLDIGSTEKAYNISVEIPGADEKDVQIELQNGNLTIRGEKKQEKEENGKNYYRRERSYGAFQRVLSLPEDVDVDGISAAFKKGVLRITLPRKAMARSDVKQIEIREAA